MQTERGLELSENEKDQYGALIQALDCNELRLVRLRDTKSNELVAGLCTVQRLDNDTFHIAPIARLIPPEEIPSFTIVDPTPGE